MFIDSSFLEIEEKSMLLRDSVSVLESRYEELNATDCSRLAWLNLRHHDAQEAMKITKHGLSIDPNNEHCKSSLDRLVTSLRSTQYQ